MHQAGHEQPPSSVQALISATSADALAQRVADCKAKVVLTASGGMRGKKPIQLKQIVDKGLKQAEKLGAKVRP